MRDCLKEIKKVETKSTSRNSANISDITLRIKETVRLIFRPEIVENPNNKEACVKGTFIYQRIGKKDEWEDSSHLKLSDIKAGDNIKLELHSEETLKLMQGLEQCKKIYNKYGIVSGENEYIISTEELDSILNTISKLPNPEVVLNSLKKLNVDDIDKINLSTGIVKLKNALEFWNDNKSDSTEALWQNEFHENPWIISQLFSYPFVLFQKEAYVGGKKIRNIDGKLVDFIYQNKLTKSVALIEIKTPSTQLIGSKYRGNYSMNSDLSGSLVQILDYKDTLQKDYYRLAEGNRNEEEFYSFNPKCILIIGNLKQDSLNHEQVKSFELFRHTSKDVDIITFDELYQKIHLLHELMIG